jgi:hypothetical protein
VISEVHHHDKTILIFVHGLFVIGPKNTGKGYKDTTVDGCSVAELVHFCAAPAPTCQKFRPGISSSSGFCSGTCSDNFPHIFLDKIQKFSWLKKCMLFKNIHNHQKVIYNK